MVQKLIFYIAGLIFVVMVLVYFLILGVLKISPKRFWKSFSPSFGIAFGTASSNAALPVAIENARSEFRMRDEIASFAIPMGTALKRDGAVILQGFTALFVAQLYNVPLTPSIIFTIMVTAMIVSFSTAGVPGAGIIMMTTVLTAAGLPLEALLLLQGLTG